MLIAFVHFDDIFVLVVTCLSYCLLYIGFTATFLSDKKYLRIVNKEVLFVIKYEVVAKNTRPRTSIKSY